MSSIALFVAAAATGDRPIGQTASDTDIAAVNLTVFADGSGLPAGSGTARDGGAIFATQCSPCHGPRGEGNASYPALVGGIGTLSGSAPVLTVGSYWPYATTVWDYVRRAMPYTRPGTLTPNQVYAVTAYVLSLNGIVSDSARLDRTTLPRIRMPNRDGFVPDPRPDVGGATLRWRTSKER